MENDTSPIEGKEWVSTLVWDWIEILRLIFAITGIIGNTLVIVVYVHRRRMRNTTNAFIVNLAVADLITSIFIIPIPVLSNIPMSPVGRLYCKMIFNLVFMWISIVASLLTLTWVSLERYFAVVYPMRYRVIFSKWRPRAIMACTWLSSVVINTFNLYIVDLNETGKCQNHWPSLGFRYLIATSVFFLEYFIPMVIMLVANIITVRTLKSQARALLQRDQSRFSPAYSLLEARRRVIETLFIVIITFIVCWTPDQIGFYIYHFGGVPDTYLGEPLYRFMVLLAFANSCANPIIYAFKNKHFRHGFMNMVRRKGNRVGSNADSLAGEEEFNTVNVTVRTVRPKAVSRSQQPSQRSLNRS
ncbi:cholecystokinin receptor type A-like [Patiria miniata]|uniref:G-protein coupled receptors family 1 profile domain-containing protein n=1 Tax=Patiria miniata TaxID=46514 RepID=A0A913YZV7_PATMI|nr:cholecystokinin receptor type A-like [Patiria miniata]